MLYKIEKNTFNRLINERKKQNKTSLKQLIYHFCCTGIHKIIEYDINSWTLLAEAKLKSFSNIRADI